MLTYINIKNFAIIKDVELDLESEMTCLTGETGAGKSIIIDSLELALGARADSSLIRSGHDKCEITVMFDIANIPVVNDWLIELDLDSDNECIIRRVISSDGRSKSSINGNTCTQQTVRNLGELLLNIHGQHENQTLLSLEHQRELLDAFADNFKISFEVRRLYEDWIDLKKELLELENLAEDQQTKIDFLNYQLEELEKIDPSTENLENLRNEQKVLSNIEEFSSNSSSALNILIENDNGSIIANLHKAKNQLETCQKSNPKIKNVIDLVDNAIIQTEEAVDSLKQYTSSIDFNPDKQQQIEEELSQIYTISRKHQVQPEELSKIKTDLTTQLDSIKSATEQLETIKVKTNLAKEKYLETANKLSKKRKTAASNLSQLVTKKMQILGMANGKFEINLLPIANQGFSAQGLERIEFLVTTNPGHPPQPLNKIASGGELSRISLAIHTITAEKEVTPTLIFDEVDAGIGGKTADIVGQLLRDISKNAQVICITHLPQIASKGHQHILIKKIANDKDTEVSLTTLGKNERIKEVARMLGGLKITDQTLAHAEEMINGVI